jgi:hypothetical protein
VSIIQILLNTGNILHLGFLTTNKQKNAEKGKQWYTQFGFSWFSERFKDSQYFLWENNPNKGGLVWLLANILVRNRETCESFPNSTRICQVDFLSKHLKSRIPEDLEIEIINFIDLLPLCLHHKFFIQRLLISNGTSSQYLFKTNEIDYIPGR